MPNPTKIARKLVVVDYVVAIIFAVIAAYVWITSGIGDAWIWVLCAAIGFTLAKLKPALWVIGRIQGSVARNAGQRNSMR
jgi:hypothetical protein